MTRYFVKITRAPREFHPSENDQLELDYSFPHSKALGITDENSAAQSAMRDFFETYTEDQMTKLEVKALKRQLGGNQ